MKKYSIRRPGCTSYADTNSLRKARKLLDEANRVIGPGHVIVEN